VGKKETPFPVLSRKGVREITSANNPPREFNYGVDIKNRQV
jgi:hypothetical protein